MWSGFSAAARAAIAGDCVVAIKVEVRSSTGVYLKDITSALTSGSVTEDETASPRRTCTLALSDLSLVPSVRGDLLHPLTGNELWVYRGVWVTGAAGPEYAPLGVFRVSNPQLADDGRQLVLTVAGRDRSSEISARKWTSPYTAAAGQTVPTAIKGIINDRWTGPALTFNLSPSTVTVPTGFTLGVQFTSYGTQAESGSTSGSNDPWADCVALALSAGCELLFDRTGIVVMRPVVQPGQSPAVATFAEGAGCTVLSAGRNQNIDNFANEVVLIGTGVTVTNSDGSISPGTPVVATASSTDPSVGINGPLGARPTFITDETVSTTAQAQTAANAQLPLVMRALDGTSLTAVDNPALDASDPIRMTRSRMKLSGVYIIQSVTHPLDATTLMAATNRSYMASV